MQARLTLVLFVAFYVALVAIALLIGIAMGMA